MNKTISLKTLVLSSLVAVLLVLFQPSTFLTSMVLCITPVAIAALYAWGGMIPAAILSGGTVFILGSLAANTSDIAVVSIHPIWAVLGALVVLVLPAVVSIAVMEKKLPFSERMTLTIVAQTVALLLCAGVVYLGLKLDLVNIITDSMRATMDVLGVEMKLSMLQTFGSMGMLTKESAEGINEILQQISQIDLLQMQLMGYTLAEQQLQTIENALTQVFTDLNYYMRQVMPAMLIHSGILSGILLTFVPSWIVSARIQKARLRKAVESAQTEFPLEDTPLEGEQEEAPLEGEQENAPLEAILIKKPSAEATLEHIPLVQWQVPRRAMGMLLVGLITGLVLQLLQLDAATAVTAVFSLSLTTLLSIQGLAAGGRFMLRMGVSNTFRRVVLIGTTIFATQIWEMVGIASTLFGSQGVYTLWIKKKMEENRKDDDE